MIPPSTSWLFLCKKSFASSVKIQPHDCFKQYSYNTVYFTNLPKILMCIFVGGLYEPTASRTVRDGFKQFIFASRGNTMKQFSNLVQFLFSYFRSSRISMYLCWNDRWNFRRRNFYIIFASVNENIGPLLIRFWTKDLKWIWTFRIYFENRHSKYIAKL